MSSVSSAYRDRMYRSTGSRAEGATWSFDGSKSNRFAARMRQRIAQLAVRLDDSRQDLRPDADLLAVVHHRDPQADDLGPAFRDDLLRLDGVAERLRHLPAFLVHEEAVGEDRPERRSCRASRDRRAASSGTTRDADRCLRDRDPPARSGPGRNGSTASWLEPESNQTSRMFVSRSNAVPPHFRACQTFRHELRQGPLVPGVRAVLVEDRGRALDDLRSEDGLAAVGAIERRNRHSPGALARDAPVGAIGDHVVDAIAAPGWESTPLARQ